MITTEELISAIERAEKTPDKMIPVKVSGARYGSRCKVADGLYGQNLGHTESGDTLAAIKSTDARKYLARVLEAEQ